MSTIALNCDLIDDAAQSSEDEVSDERASEADTPSGEETLAPATARLDAGNP